MINLYLFLATLILLTLAILVKNGSIMKEILSAMQKKGMEDLFYPTDSIMKGSLRMTKWMGRASLWGGMGK